VNGAQVDVDAALGEAIWTAEGGTTLRPREIEQLRRARAAYLALVQSTVTEADRMRAAGLDPSSLTAALAHCGVSP